jgi:hypothetical protein
LRLGIVIAAIKLGYPIPDLVIGDVQAGLFEMGPGIRAVSKHGSIAFAMIHIKADSMPDRVILPQYSPTSRYS